MDSLSRITPATIDVLRVLSRADAPVWGMLVITQSGRPAGSVYPILERLESAGWVSSSWEEHNDRPGPRRRYYELTEQGSPAAAAAVAAFAAKKSGSTAARVVVA